MEKPITLSVKNFLIRKISSDMIIPEKTVEAIVTHQFAALMDATKRVQSVEMSGFGRFLFNRKKAMQRMVKFMNTKRLYERQLLEDITPARRKSLESKLNSITVNIEALKPKLNEDL